MLTIVKIFGNLFYSTSLLTNPCAWYTFGPYGGGGWAGEEGSQQLEWLARAAPFWLGAAGVLGLDAAVGMQFLIYGDASDDEGRWGVVTGWMRGWVPYNGSVENLERIKTNEEARLLADDGSASDYGTL